MKSFWSWELLPSPQPSSDQQGWGRLLARPGLLGVFLLLGFIHSFGVEDSGVWSWVHVHCGGHNWSQVHVGGEVGVGHGQPPDERGAVDAVGLRPRLVVGGGQPPVQSSTVGEALHAPRCRLVRGQRARVLQALLL